MGISLEQATRFYETLAKLVGSREGVDIKVISVQPREKAGDGGQEGRGMHRAMQESKAV